MLATLRDFVLAGLVFVLVIAAVALVLAFYAAIYLSVVAIPLGLAYLLVCRLSGLWCL